MADGADVVSIWGGAPGILLQKSDGTVWTWGANFGGKLGIGLPSTNLGRVLVPAEVHGLGDVGFLNSVCAIMGGEVHNGSATGEYFTIEYTTNFPGGFTGIVQTNILATPPQNVVTVPATDGNRYYRLRF